MSLPASQASKIASTSLPLSAIFVMVGQGMTVREILSVFPELSPEDVHEGLLRAAEILRDTDASLPGLGNAEEIIRAAQQSSGLEEGEAMELAVSETRKVRRDPSSR